MFNCKYYPVPIINKDTFRKKVEHLVKIVVLTLLQKSQYGTSVSVIPNKDITVRFITYYLRINQKLVRKTYPLPIIGNTMKKLEGFRYATALELNMGYYNIRLSLVSQDMTTIFNEFGKVRYNHLPMGVCFSGDIFQSNVDVLIGDI